MAYSKSQLELIWESANPGEGNPHLMAAIALAESSGSASSVNSIGACGLWQIHPYEAGCTSPITNARMAGEKLKSQGLGAWETYTNGAYKQYYTGVAEDVSSEGPIVKLREEGKLEPSNPVEQNPADPLGSNFLGLGSGGLGKIVGLLDSERGWIRIGKVLVGLFLLLSGVLGMANTNVNPRLPAGSPAPVTFPKPHPADLIPLAAI